MYRFLKPLLLACVVCIMCCGISRGEAPAVSPRALYLQALDAMSNIAEPPYVTYDLLCTGEGLSVVLAGKHPPCLPPGKNDDRWVGTHRTSDYLTRIVDTGKDDSFVSTANGLDPTWYGAYRALRTGIIDEIGTYHLAPPLVTPPPIATDVPAAPDTGLKTIAIVEAIGPGIYNIEDRGSAPCSNGDRGHALHLWSRAKNPYHQLSDVIIDLSNMRFCMVRFSLNARGVLGGSVTWEEHFGNVGVYWLETDGVLEGTQRLFGISAGRARWIYRLANVQFPVSEPASIFQQNTTKD